MKTAIIGLGNIGNQVALNLIAGGQQVIVAPKHQTATHARRRSPLLLMKPMS
jgi:Trk K+ transport system NAD-binding subunit